MKKTVTESFEKYGTDKIESGYNKVYDELFSEFQLKKFNFLEIGIGTITTIPLPNMNHIPSSMRRWKEIHENYLPGASLKSFRDYFENAEIYGVDIQPDCMIEEERIKTFLFDSTDKKLCDNNFLDLNFDIIIDDGDHLPQNQIKTFENLYHRVNEGGYYIIEDVAFLKEIEDYFSNKNLNHVFYNRLLVIKKNSERKGSVKILGVEIAQKGYYINLDSCVDRKESVEKQIEKYKIENLERFSALTDPARHFSCTKTHLEIFRKSESENIETLLILEDDFQIRDICKINEYQFDFRETISKVMEDLKNHDWDVVLLGCNPKTFLVPISNFLSLNYKSTGSWAYIIKRKAYNHILNNSNYQRDYLAIDDWLCSLSNFNFKVLTTTPKLISHGVGFESTLLPSAGKVNYDTWIEGNYDLYLYKDITSLDFVKNYDIEREITIVITGHFVQNFLFYLRYLLHSIPTDLIRCKFMIVYDTNNDTASIESIRELQDYFKNRNKPINYEIIYSKGGLIDSFNVFLDKLKTKYFILLEHDWVFLKSYKIDFENLLGAFNNHTFINAVWFGKDDNVMRGFEIGRDVENKTTPFERENRVNEVDLVTTCRWSNNPVMFRTSKMIEWFNTIIKNEHIGRVHQGQHNVEETIIPQYRKIIGENRWVDIRDDWGTFLYGNLNEGPYVGHTDASRRYQTTIRTAAEDNGDEYIKNNPLITND